MKLFPTAVISWNEPASYSYAASKAGVLWKALFLVGIFAGVFFRSPRLPWWTFLIFAFLAVGTSFLPFAHRRWPKLFPLTGANVTLFEDRITRRSGRTGANVMLANLAQGTYWKRRDAEGDYWVLRFEPKKAGFGLVGILKEVAIPDSQIFERVVLALRERSISVRELPEAVSG